MRLTGLYFQPPKGRELYGKWVAVYRSPGGSRVIHWDLPKDITKEQKDKAEQMAQDHEKGLTWEGSKAKTAPKPPATVQESKKESVTELLDGANMHKATPVSPLDNKYRPTCDGCGQYLRRVPGGQGITWVHADSGAVIGKNA